MTTIFSPATVLDSTGLHMPRLDEVVQAIGDIFRGVYGSDIDLDPESPDGQLVAALGEMYYDQASLLQLIWDTMANPDSMSGSLLSGVARFNGVTRNVGRYSSAVLTITGEVGKSVDTSFRVKSATTGKLFAATGSATVGQSGTATVGVQCTEKGNIDVSAGTLTKIVTVVPGIVSVTNTSAGTVGEQVEGDAALRSRRIKSVALPSQWMTDGLQAAIMAISDDVLECVVWENPTDDAIVMTGGSLDPHSVYVIADLAEGSALLDQSNKNIAEAILLRKSGGCSTMGSESRSVEDSQGHANTAHYDYPEAVDVYIEVNGTGDADWPSDGADQIKTKIANWAKEIPESGPRNVTIGGDANGKLSWSKVLTSFLGKVPGFELTSMKLGTTQGGGTAGASLSINFNQIARIDTSRITVNVT